MIKSIGLTLEGIEDISALEVKELIGKDAVKGKSIVEFNADSVDDLFRLCYSSQSMSKIILLLKKFHVKNDFFKELKANIKDIDFKDWVEESTKIAFRSERLGIHEFKSTDIESNAAECFFETNKAKVNLKSPELIIFILLIDEDCYIGIDFSGNDLSKRDYKIFSNMKSLNPSVAYSLVRLSGYDGKEILLDPFSGSGEIGIEAVLFACNHSPRYYSKDKFAFRRIPRFKSFDFDSFFDKIDKKSRMDNKEIYSLDNQLKNVMAIRKNAKIAGMHKFLTMTRVDIDWLETRFEKGKVGKIVAYLPDIPKHGDKNAIEKVITEFFYQAEFILSAQGIIVIVCKNNEYMKSPLKKYSFNLVEEKTIWQGKEKLIVSIIRK